MGSECDVPWTRLRLSMAAVREGWSAIKSIGTKIEGCGLLDSVRVGA